MLRIGKVEILRADDGPFRLDGGGMFGVVPRTMWEKECPADDRNRIAMTANCYLSSAGGHRVLVDAGIGRSWDEKWRSIYGVDEAAPTLLDSLAALGVGPEDVDTVLLTHLHFDHCGWATRPDGAGGGGGHRPTFPNAEYLVHQLEWEDAHDVEGRAAASYINHLFDPLEAAGLLRLLEGSGETAVTDWLTAIPTGGHTRGHLAWRIDSGGHNALGPSELCPLAAHRRARWIMAYDLYPVETLAAKRKLLTAAEAGNWPLLLNHETGTPAGRLVRTDPKHLDLAPVQI